MDGEGKEDKEKKTVKEGRKKKRPDREEVHRGAEEWKGKGTEAKEVAGVDERKGGGTQRQAKNVRVPPLPKQVQRELVLGVDDPYEQEAVALQLRNGQSRNVCITQLAVAQSNTCTPRLTPASGAGTLKPGPEVHCAACWQPPPSLQKPRNPEPLPEMDPFLKWTPS
jgi:hypothetical protein